MSTPAPFNRPSINLGGHARDWQEVTADKLSPGDTVRGFGTINSVGTGLDAIYINWSNGTTSVFVTEDVVTAFTAVQE